MVGYGRSNGKNSNASKWILNSQGARANARARSGRGMNEEKLRSLQWGDNLDKQCGFPLLEDILEMQNDSGISYSNTEMQDIDGTNVSTGDNGSRLGWLLNIRSCTIPDPNESSRATPTEISALDLYFIQQDGAAFKTRVIHQPYFYVKAARGKSNEVIAYCLRRFEGLVIKAEKVRRHDLDEPNHLSSRAPQSLLVKLSFHSTTDLVTVKSALLPIIQINQAHQSARQAYEIQGSNPRETDQLDDEMNSFTAHLSTSQSDESESSILALREYDIPHAMRIAIDYEIRVGSWYLISHDPAAPYQPKSIQKQSQIVDKAEPVVCAFDIECTKAPLKFPDAEAGDQIYMISYMIDRQGYLIINREFVSQDVDDFEYTPKEHYPGPFIVLNFSTEKEVLRAFFDHMKEIMPQIYVTYNGDFFDWPFIETRARIHHMSLLNELGISCDKRSGEYRGRGSIHLDAFCWVQRDSYLPQGSQGLKAVTKYKLGYDPVEVDAEDMVTMARVDPMKMASYSVSDAVATFYLYDKYVHLFVFSLCTIIPLGAEDVLRKGSGTLCEALLMVEAYRSSIVCPNKQSSSVGLLSSELDGVDAKSYYKGHVIESETYVGGHVECLESGVFRADLEYDFQLVPSAFDSLISNLDRDLEFALTMELGVSLESIKNGEVVNYNAIKEQISSALEKLRNTPSCKAKPLIYHLDVAAMYPNIILTNRLQPCSIVNEADCAACVFNTECGKSALKSKENSTLNSKSCQRDMDWVWRGDYYPATRSEFNSIKSQLAYENVSIQGVPQDRWQNERKSSEVSADKTVPFTSLSADQKHHVLKSRLKQYCSSVYKKLKITEEEKRQATVCMRENPFYVDTVRAFRDRRYEYKGLTKKWKGEQVKADKNNDIMAAKDAQNKALIYDSLQLAHKCILNSFYGYVMRKGARWHSMEMAGIVTHTGSEIIKKARELVEQIGRPLELDTDGIWAILPGSFPENFAFELKNGSKKRISYPCVMLNAMVNAEFTNHQYHSLLDNSNDQSSGNASPYTVKSECSIFFEVDGPYKCMVLPASTEEGKLLKKRYAVFNIDNTLAELKGFEVKRRGELQLIKAFQSQVFECFLDGSSLRECYASVAACANRWLDVIDTKGAQMEDDEVMALLTENKNLSQKLSEYGSQKSTSITTARRLAEFLGEEMVKDKGLTCKMVIAAKPHGVKVTERAIPVAIFSAEPSIKKFFLRKWLKDPQLEEEQLDLRSVLDWEYYRGRFSSTVQKIICLPAAFQHIPNPVPRIPLPDWMRKHVRERNATHQQGRMTSFLVKDLDFTSDAVAKLIDIEDFGKQTDTSPKFKSKNSIMHDPNQKADEIMDIEINDESYGKRVMDNDGIDFPQWLKHRKRKWRQLVEKRKKRRELNPRLLSSNTQHYSTYDMMDPRDGGTSLDLNPLSLSDYVLNTSSLLLQCHWQILEIQSNNNGQLTCWVLTSQSSRSNKGIHIEPMLHRVSLRLPRVFYLKCRDEEAEEVVLETLVNPQDDNEVNKSPLAKRVMRVVPHGSVKPQSVLEIKLSETLFQQNQKEMIHILSDPVIESVHELQVSQISRAVTSLGCTVQFTRSKARQESSSEFEIDDLQFLSTAQAPYLEGDTIQSLGTNLRHILLYVGQSNKRAIVAVMTLDCVNSTSLSNENVHKAYEGKATVWYVDPVSNIKARNADLTTAFDLLRQEMKKFASVSNHHIVSCSFKSSVVRTISLAFAGVNQVFASVTADKQNNSSTPIIVLAQTSFNSSKKLRDKITGLHQFPMTLIPWQNEDLDFPALTWRKFVSERFVLRAMGMVPFFAEICDCARYSHIPVGNFTGDHAMAMLDTLYSRLLFKHKHLWWHGTRKSITLASFPMESLGGLKQPKAKAGTAVESTDVGGCAFVCVKGSYPDICVEIEVDGLAVNAVLIANQIHSIEEVTGLQPSKRHTSELGFEGSNNNADTSSSSKIGGILEQIEELGPQEAFRILRSMVTTLFRDFLSTQNKFADICLQQFYRWITNPKAKCFDPSLRDMVKRIMDKLFLQLLAEFRRLGAQIIYADSSKLIICTKKQSIEHAQSYVSFILQTVSSNDLFQVLSFTQRRYFSNYFFLDAENYGGRLLQTDVRDDTGSEGTTEDSDEENGQPASDNMNIVAHWNIANFLPQGIDDYFRMLVSQFIRRRAEFQESDRHNESVEESMNDEDDEIVGYGSSLTTKAQQRLARYSRNLLSTYFSEKLLRLVPEILSYPAYNASSFPIFAGSHIPLESPALELVKFTCAVFELEPAVDEIVQKMKRTLLKLLNVSSFSEKATFRNPSLSLYIPDVICPVCNLCRAVDLCRDPQLFQLSAETEDGNEDTYANENSNGMQSWNCPRCATAYNKEEFEQRLVEMANSLSVHYQEQDIYCIKCHLPAEHRMKEYCPCSGTYELGIRDSVLLTLRILRRVAQQHRFLWLHETIERLEIVV